MEVRQLRYFVAVAEHQHFGAAAESLHIVQGAVSKQIARLERELGLTLFDRSHRRATLTPDGHAFLAHARRALDAVDGAAAAARRLAVARSPTLRIGSSEGLGSDLELILLNLRSHHPSVRIDLVSASTPAKLLSLTNGNLEAAFVRAPMAVAGVTIHHLWDEPLLAVVPPAFGLVPDLRALADLPLARTDRAFNPGVYDLISQACRSAGFQPLAGPALASIQDLVVGPIAAGQCWTLLYRSTAPTTTAVHVMAPQPPIVVPTGLAVADQAQHAYIDHLVNSAQQIARTRTS